MLTLTESNNNHFAVSHTVNSQGLRIKSTLPHTADNVVVLRESAGKIANCFGRRVQELEAPGLWNRICNYFPSSQSMGYKAGEALAMTYGASWSNTAIELVVKRVFQPEVPQVSYLSLQGLRGLFFGATHQTLSETLKLTFTPKALPYLAFVSGTLSSIALPTLICLVSIAYQRAMNDMHAVKQISNLSLNELFTVDAETGRLRDAFGRLLSFRDMKDIFSEAAKYDLICRLIDLCNEIDRTDGDDDALENEAKKMFAKLQTNYVIERSDGVFMFPDGHQCTDADQGIIREGIEDLSRINPCKKEEKIQRFIELLASHSLLPFETFSLTDEVGLTACPKRIPPLFMGEEHAWKNAILRTHDGKYVITQDLCGKLKGTVVDEQEMQEIFGELESLQFEKAQASEEGKLGTSS